MPLRERVLSWASSLETMGLIIQNGAQFGPHSSLLHCFKGAETQSCNKASFPLKPVQPTSLLHLKPTPQKTAEKNMTLAMMDC